MALADLDDDFELGISTKSVNNIDALADRKAELFCQLDEYFNTPNIRKSKELLANILSLIKRINSYMLADNAYTVPELDPDLEQSVLFDELIKGIIHNVSTTANLNWLNTVNITNMDSLFYFTDFNGNISKWNVSNVKTMASMFEYSAFDNDISNWDVSNVRNMNNMFSSTIFNGDISKWNVNKVLTANKMFNSSLFNNDISNLNFASLKKCKNMFLNCHISDSYLPTILKNKNLI